MTAAVTAAMNAAVPNPDLPACRAADLRAQGPSEHAFAALARLPGLPGAMGYRKLKRRLQHRAEARFRALAAVLGPGDLALDLGANVGDMTAVLAANGATVHAYEPEPDTFALLRTRFADAPNVAVHQAAIADRAGQADLVLPASFADRPRSASKAASIAHDRYRGDGAVTRMVALHDIRDVMAALPQPPRIIKMDIEGAELPVLEAMRAADLIAPDTAVFVETHERLDPASLGRVLALQAWARDGARGYVNLNWG